MHLPVVLLPVCSICTCRSSARRSVVGFVACSSKDAVHQFNMLRNRNRSPYIAWWDACGFGKFFGGLRVPPPPGAARRARTGLASRPPCGAKPLFWPSEGTGVGRCAGPPRRPGDWDWGPRALARYRLQDAIPN
jgi:hypothetical protein